MHGWGFGAGISVFFAWAVCREIDPDHELSAFVAAGLTLVGVFFFYPPAFLGVVWLLLMLRIVNRTTGVPAFLLDSVILTLFSAWFTFQGYWIYGIITTVAFYLDSRLDLRSPRQLYFSLANALIIAVVWIAKGFPESFAYFPLTYPVVPVLVIVFFVPVIVSYRNVRSKGDLTGSPLRPARVISGQILAIVTGLQLILQSGYTTLLPLYGAIAGPALYWYFSLAFGTKK